MGGPAGNLEIAGRYLGAIEQGATREELSRFFFAPDSVLDEFPNRVVPLGKRRGLAEALEGAERGRIMSARSIR